MFYPTHGKLLSLCFCVHIQSEKYGRVGNVGEVGHEGKPKIIWLFICLLLCFGAVKVLIVKLSAFGDIIHSLPALDDVLARPDVSEVHWLVDARFVFVTEVFPANVKVHQIALKGEHPLAEIRQTVKKLRAEHFDVVLDLQGLVKSAVLSRLICKKVFGFDAKVIREKPASWLQTSVPFHPDDITITQQCLKIAQAPWAGKNSAAQAIGYQVPQIHRDFDVPLPSNIDASQPWIVFNLGGSFATKELPDQTWLSVGKSLKHKGFQIVWCWGNAKEEAKAKQLNQDGLGVVLEKRLGMPELCAFLKQSYAVIVADTGILHLASALGTPTVSFWGPTPRWRNAPHAPHDQYVESNPECGPCIKKTCDNFICMDMIQTAEIVKCVDQIQSWKV